MEREIALDTETTGIEVAEGHRIIEIGCVELINRIPTGKVLHEYINPEREVSQGAFEVHGISNEFLSDKPKFENISEKFSQFIGNDKLIIHNAKFDVKFLNAELFHVKKPEIKFDRTFCTLNYARKKFPGAQNNLDALCRRFGIDNSRRDKHGALLDAEILAEVYLELMGGAQVTIGLESSAQKAPEKSQDIEETKKVQNTKKANFKYRNFEIKEEEFTEHKNMLRNFEESLWHKVKEV